MTSQVVRNLQMEITIVTCNLVRFSIFWSTSDNFWCAEFNESCNVSLCSTNSSIILCVKQHVQTTYKVCYKPLNIVKLVIVVRFQFSCLVYNIIQLFNGGGSNSSKYLAWGNGNDQVNYCTRPEVMEMIKWTIVQGQLPSAIVHLIISIIEGQIFWTIAATTIK